MPEAALPGAWKASPSPNTQIELNLDPSRAFTWKVTINGKPNTIQGQWSYADGVLTLAAQGQNGAMVGRVVPNANQGFSFQPMGTEGSAPGLAFSR
jgi:hypothetical protein